MYYVAIENNTQSLKLPFDTYKQGRQMYEQAKKNGNKTAFSNGSRMIREYDGTTETRHDKRGGPGRPNKGNKRIHVYLPADLVEQIDKEAKQENMTRSDVIGQILQDIFDCQ